tara:strand:- start:339 stop:1460 length:1122 start_codon:yes stop_codon:yes gene_type:complete
MSVIFDAHAHCFPPLGLDRGDKQYYDMCSAEHQYHVRFHPQGVRRSSDSSLISLQKQNSILTGEHDGVSWLPDISFRIGEFGRLEFTHEEQDYYMQWMPPSLTNMESSPEHLIAQMEYAGVDRSVLQHDRVYGHLDEFLGECVKKYPNKLVGLAQVQEWRAGEPDQLDRLKYQVLEQGFRGVYFSTGGFFHVDFNMSVNDSSLDPFWSLVEELNIPIHWYAGEYRNPMMEVYLRELEDFTFWAESHQNIPSVLTHGLNNISMLKGEPDIIRYQLPEVMVRLLKYDNWSIELMLHLMASDSPYPPYNPHLEKIVEDLMNEIGIEKLMWGSDMPCCERTLSYKQSLVLYKEKCEFLTQDQTDLIIGGNLEKLYPL